MSKWTVCNACALLGCTSDCTSERVFAWGRGRQWPPRCRPLANSLSRRRWASRSKYLAGAAHALGLPVLGGALQGLTTICAQPFRAHSRAHSSRAGPCHSAAVLALFTSDRLVYSLVYLEKWSKVKPLNLFAWQLANVSHLPLLWLCIPALFSYAILHLLATAAEEP